MSSTATEVPRPRLSCSSFESLRSALCLHFSRRIRHHRESRHLYLTYRHYRNMFCVLVSDAQEVHASCSVAELEAIEFACPEDEDMLRELLSERRDLLRRDAVFAGFRESVLKGGLLNADDLDSLKTKV